MTETEWLASEDPAAMLRHLTEEYVGYPFIPDADRGEKRWIPRQKLLISERKAELLWQIITKKSNFEEQHQFKPDSYITAVKSWCTDSPHTIPQAEKAHLLREIVGNPFRSAKVGDWLTPKVREFAQIIYGIQICDRCDGEGYLEWESWGRMPCPICNAQPIRDHGFLAEAMPVLGDMLEEAGCADEEILNHCRNKERCPNCCGDWIAAQYPGATAEPRECCDEGFIPLRGPHVRGCWVVDLILGLE